jgi:hypothetical protein
VATSTVRATYSLTLRDGMAAVLVHSFARSKTATHPCVATH